MITFNPIQTAVTITGGKRNVETAALRTTRTKPIDNALREYVEALLKKQIDAD